MSGLVDAAICYAELGFSVFPCAPGSKQPITENGFHDATTDTRQIERWWTAANIGIATQRLLILDIEPEATWLTGTSTKAWCVFVSPADAALIVAFLQGRQSPTIEFFSLDDDPNNLAATWRVYFARGDFRAAYRAKGEA